MRVVGAKETWYDHFGKVRHFLKKLNTYLPPDPNADIHKVSYFCLV